LPGTTTPADDSAVPARPTAAATADATGAAAAAAAAASAAWRHESAHVLATLVRMTGDVDLADDLAQEAMLAALQQWPVEGIPDNPAAWLVSVAKRRAIDHFRRSETRRRLVERLGETQPGVEDADPTDQVDRVEDDVLRLVYLACHPVLPPDARAALTLRLVCGLTTSEIARAYLVKDPTIGQRITRAKRLLVEQGVPFELPDRAERAGRLADVMRVIYLIFNEGYTATSGDAWMRPDLCLEALRLARMLAALEPTTAEVHGLVALLEIQASRTPARVGPDGEPVLLEDQDRTLWDGLLVERGQAALGRAEALGQPAGPYVVQAAIAATHAQARRAEDTDWVRIARLYDLLARTAPSPIVEVNRAVAHGRAYGPDAGLAVLVPLERDPVLAASHLLPSVRGDLLARAGRPAEAAAAFLDAAALTRNESERRLLRRRAAGLD
jgi:RNA polymerase sigma factor (sigma-70 family)